MSDDPRRRWIRSTLWVGLLGAMLVLWFNGSQRIRLVSPGEAVPAGRLALADVTGRQLDLEAYRGRVVLLNAWASWCAPCRAEQPRLTRVEAEFRDDGLVVLGMNVEGLGWDELGRIAREWEIRYPIVVPAKDLTGTPFAGEGVIPHTWLVDRSGRIRASKAGVVSERSLRQAVEALLNETSDPGAGPAGS